jgi:hypothetical protein
MATPDIDVIKWLKRINGKFQNPFGITIWATDALGNQVQVLCLPNGTLVVNGIVAIVGPVDVSDRAARLLGIIYGSQGAQLLQRAATFDTLVQLRSAGVEIDPRDVTDRAARLLGVIYGSLAQVQQRAATFDLYVQLRNAGVEIDPRAIRALTIADQISVQAIGGATWDVSDRAARLLGIAYGSLAQLQQRAATFELLVQLTSAGVQIDPRSIRALTIADQVSVQPIAGQTWDVSDRAARLLGIIYGSQSQQLLQRAVTFDTLVQLRSGGVEIDPRAIINDMAAGQSTNVPLAGGATYTSGTMTGDGYRRITGSVTADVAGTLYIEQSPNAGANWDVSDAIPVAPGATLGFCVEVVCPSLRIRYVNGGAGQATFRLYSFLRTI